MIENTYAKAILNILMAKPIASNDGENDPALAERAELRKKGVKLYVEPNSNQTSPISTADTKEIDNSEHWRVQNITKVSENGKTFYGYKTVRRDLTSNKMYPTTRYLALLTKMPNPDGSGFEEFRIIHEIKDGETIYCKRINLNTGYFSNDLIMRAAEMNTEKIDPENESLGIVGGAITLNDVVIYFPEITVNDWGSEDEDENGPALLGFGIFKNEEPVEGEKPYLWGALSNDDAAAKREHVPLFRRENFQFSIK